MIENRSRPVVFSFPDAVDNWGKERVRQTRDKMADYERLSREVDDLLRVGNMEIKVRLNLATPIRLLPFSDTHLYSKDTEECFWQGEIKRRIMNDPDTFGAIMGDFLQGYNPTNPDLVNRVFYDMTGQILKGRDELDEMVRRGKILWLMNGYSGHEPWTKKLAGLDAIAMLVNGIKQPDGTPVQVVNNTGVVKMYFPNNNVENFKVAHNSGSGGNRHNPVGGLRRMVASEKLDDENFSGTAMAGHFHSLAAAEELLLQNKLTGSTVERRLWALGTIQGVAPERPQEYLTSKGLPLSRFPGVADIILQTRRGIEHWPVFGYEKSDALLEGARLWDKAGSTGMTRELVEKIIDRSKKPVAKFLPNESRKALRVNAEGTESSPLWETMTWEINGGFRLPIVLYILANARYGSSSTDEKGLKRMVSESLRNPLAYVMVGRHMIDYKVSRDLNREGVLTKMADTLAPIAKKGKMLGVMLSGSLREDSWKSNLGPKNDPISEGIVTGDFLYNESGIKGVPLYSNEALVDMRVGTARYLLLAMDHLSGSGSIENPFLGLIKARERVRLSLDLVFGGHNPGVGVLDTADCGYIAPGWFARYGEKSKSNEVEVPTGGQGVILFANQKMQIPGSTFEKLRDMHEALILREGMTKEEKKNLLGTLRRK